MKLVCRLTRDPAAACRAVWLVVAIACVGCGAGRVAGHGTAVAVSGHVFGGQQAVAGSVIQLYAVGSSGDGSAATSLLTQTVTTDAYGNFNLAGDYICPANDPDVYLVATAGNPGLPGAASNSALALMAALGPCQEISGEFILMNEVTTVGSLAALYPYATGLTAIGAGGSDAGQLIAAFQTVNEYTNIATGSAPGPALPSGYEASSIEINTLADVLASCVNSAGGTAGDHTLCGNLFALATPPSGVAPTDTVGALIDILENPTQNVTAILNLIPPTGAPFQPVLSQAPLAWTLPIVGVPAVSVVMPSASGLPHSVTVFGQYEFVSVQGTGQIFTYQLESGRLVQVGAAYSAPCSDPSGMVVTTISGVNVMAVVCDDTGALATLTVNSDGSLSALGSVGGLATPFFGIALDGTNVYVPLFGTSGVANGGVARVSLANPSAPVVTGTVMLASPGPNEYVNASYLAVANGSIYVVAGSESAPKSSSSTIQVVDEASMTLLGAPFVVDHSPQAVAVSGNVLLVTSYDAEELQSIDVSNPAQMRTLEVMSLATPGCAAIPVQVVGTNAFVGCYAEGTVLVVDVSQPTVMRVKGTIQDIALPEDMALAGADLLVTSYGVGGDVYAVDTTQE